MRNNKWMPIALITALIGLGLWVSLSMAFSKNKKGTPVPERLPEQTESSRSEHTPEPVEMLDMQGILRGIDAKESRIFVYLPSERKEAAFFYDLATSVRNRYDREVVMETLTTGMVLDLFLEESGRLKKVEESKESWEYKGVGNLRIDAKAFLMKIGERMFQYDAGITVTDGKDAMKVSELLPEKDILDVRGIGDKIVSISVAKGHGSLELVNYDEFIGGKIEVGYEVFEEIAENVKFILREGKYKVVLENGGLAVHKVMEIKRNRNIVLDLEGVTAGLSKKSKVSLLLSPNDASVFIDGKEVDGRRNLTLSYGEYIVKVTKEGYTEWEDILSISKPNEKIRISLATAKKKEADEKEGKEQEEDGTEVPDEEDRTDSDNENETRSENEDIEVRTDTERKISFLKPLGATILFDGRAIGVVPCEMEKITGEHKITVSKDGYSSQTYTIDILDDGEDAIFSFPELTE